MKSYLLLIVLFGYAFFIYWAISAANTRAANTILSTAGYLPQGDKLGHFLLMGSLAMVVNFALQLRTIKMGPVTFLFGSLFVAAASTLEELTQVFIPSRTFSIFDLAADYAGIYLFGLAAIWLTRGKFFQLLGLNLWQRKAPGKSG
jgi:VanZ family protein